MAQASVWRHHTVALQRGGFEGLLGQTPPHGDHQTASKATESAAPEEQGDLSTLLMQGEDVMEQLASAHQTWGLGTADRWGLDQ
jgi:hypothetical protein